MITEASTKFVLRFFVEGTAIPKQSFKVGPGGQGYTPDQVKAWEDGVRTMARNAMRLQELEKTSLPVRATIEFTLPDRRRKDLDNLCKAMFDGMKGEVFDDDDQIVELNTRKVYMDQMPRDGSVPVGVLVNIREG